MKYVSTYFLKEHRAPENIDFFQLSRGADCTTLKFPRSGKALATHGDSA